MQTLSICWKTRFVVVLAAGVLILAAPRLARAENLLKNPSFEQTSRPNEAGVQFTDWSGQVDHRRPGAVNGFPNGYLDRNPDLFLVGNIAHSGKTSFEMMGEQGSNLRLLSPEISLKSGRYRLSMFLRGLTIGKTKDGKQLELSIAPEQVIDLKKDGTFGWTQLTYVFDAADNAKPFQLAVGLVSSGWLWVDDVSLEAVDAATPLTKEPAWGKEESPIASPANLGADAANCPQCGTLSAQAEKQCYACGQELVIDEVKWPKVKMLADLEGLKISGVKPADDSPLGKGALRGSNLTAAGTTMDLSRYDYLAVDVFNSGKEFIRLSVAISDVMSDDYWTNLNTTVAVPPGASVIRVPLDSYLGEKSRPGRTLMRGQVKSLNISGRGQIDFLNPRLERADAGAVAFAGLRAFDFGPLQSSVMPGFKEVTSAMAYEPTRGFGWENADIVRAATALQPDALYQDWINVQKGGFRVDLPNGKYHVIMNLDMPAAYWGQMENYTQRVVKANGKVAVDDKMDLPAFIKNYFRNAHSEDLPGQDVFKKYGDSIFTPKQFDVEVTDGKLVLDFDGLDYANSLSALVIYPADKAQQGQKFWDWVGQRRRGQFEDHFHFIAAKRVVAPPAEGYVLFVRGMMDNVGPTDGPSGKDAIPAEGLKQSLAIGEESPVVFSLQPSGDLGQVDVTVSDLSAGDKAKLPASAVRVGYLDYRIQRAWSEGTGYTIAPRYWQEGPAPAGNVTRTFWIRVKIPAGTTAGQYAGTITVKPAKADAKTIPLTIRVLNFTLDPVTDVEVGSWGSGFRLPWTCQASDKVEQWKWEMFDRALTAIHDAGCTSFSGRPSLKVTAKDGKITLHTEMADKEMALIRQKGFTMAIGSYGTQFELPYEITESDDLPDVRSAKAAGFADMESFLKALWTAVDQHAIEKNWVPVIWSLCDEPIEGAGMRSAIANAKAHRAISGDLKRTLFIGDTSLTKDNARGQIMDLIKALPIITVNLHDEVGIKAIKDAGNRFSFYNGGNRWTMGRYLKMLVTKHQMMYHLIWHFNAIKGDPYNALDSREDDYCWFNTDEKQTMVPSLSFLQTVIAGVNDYRYLSTLERLLKEKPDHPAAAEARKVFDDMMNLTPGKDRDNFGDFDKDRAAVTAAIESMMK